MATKEKEHEGKREVKGSPHTEERVEQGVIKTKETPRRKGKERSLESATIVASQVIQPSSALNPRSSILNVITVARKVIRQQIAGLPKELEREDKRVKVMGYMRLHSTYHSTLRRIQEH